MTLIWVLRLKHRGQLRAITAEWSERACLDLLLTSVVSDLTTQCEWQCTQDAFRTLGLIAETTFGGGRGHVWHSLKVYWTEVCRCFRWIKVSRAGSCPVNCRYDVSRELTARANRMRAGYDSPSLPSPPPVCFHVSNIVPWASTLVFVHSLRCQYVSSFITICQTDGIRRMWMFVLILRHKQQLSHRLSYFHVYPAAQRMKWGHAAHINPYCAEMKVCEETDVLRNALKRLADHILAANLCIQAQVHSHLSSCLMKSLALFYMLRAMKQLLMWIGGQVGNKSKCRGSDRPLIWTCNVVV